MFNALKIDGRSFYELKIQSISDYYPACPAGEELCYVVFDHMPIERQTIDGLCKVEVSAVFFERITEAFFSGKTLFVAFDENDKHRARIDAVLPKIVPIERKRS
ncbi:MAG: hypothetical protein M0Q90_16340 [Bacteroidales bacterium]|jgi:hypothetical protein|nr:hypothetical protein [Bacteroidales bacterium]